jgi:nucleoside-diphosphate-sugar epimerase
MDPISSGAKVLITGAAGYLGKELAGFLAGKGLDIYGLDINPGSTHPGVRMYEVDILDESGLKSVVREIQPDYIYHLAAILDRRRDFSIANRVLEINLLGTVNLLNALKELSFEKILFASTSEVYGSKASIGSFEENGDYIPASPYSLSKYCAESAIRTFSEIYGKHYTILRLFNFFGSNMPNGFFLSQLIQKLQNNEDFDMTEGAQKRDFVYIKDVLEALYLSASSGANQMILNVASGESVAIRELALSLKGFLKSSSKINFGAIPYRENEVWDMSGNIEQIKKSIGWSPEYSIQEAIEDMIFTKRPE